MGWYLIYTDKVCLEMLVNTDGVIEVLGTRKMKRYYSQQQECKYFIFQI